MSQKYKNIILVLLIFVGIILRFAGLFVNGNHNFDTYREWGYFTRTTGLANAFAGGYGPISYLIMGICDYFSTFYPNIWWFPYKFSNFIFDILIYLLLLVYLKHEEWKVTLAYWLNPWFLIPGSWQGFWDSPFGFFILLTVVVFDKAKNSKFRFFITGLLMGISYCIKPQIIAPMSILVVFFTINYLFRLKFKEILHFSIGLLIFPIIFNRYFILEHKPILYFPKVYNNFSTFMPYLVNSEVNIWHTTTRVIMYFQNMTGPVYSLSTLTYPYNYLEKASYLIYGLLVLIFVFKLRNDKEEKNKIFFLTLFILPFFLMPQILTRSHAYHFYPASLLLIPYIIITKNRTILIIWLLSVFIHFYNIFDAYDLGRGFNNPIHLIREPVISILGFIQFCVTIAFIYYFIFNQKILKQEK